MKDEPPGRLHTLPPVVCFSFSSAFSSEYFILISPPYQELHDENHGELPSVLKESVEVLRQRGLDVRGLFSGCAEHRKVQLLIKAWNQGHNPLRLANIADCYAVSLHFLLPKLISSKSSSPRPQHQWLCLWNLWAKCLGCARIIPSLWDASYRDVNGGSDVGCWEFDGVVACTA